MHAFFLVPFIWATPASSARQLSIAPPAEDPGRSSGSANHPCSHQSRVDGKRHRTITRHPIPVADAKECDGASQCYHAQSRTSCHPHRSLSARDGVGSWGSGSKRRFFDFNQCVGDVVQALARVFPQAALEKRTYRGRAAWRARSRGPSRAPRLTPARRPIAGRCCRV